MDELSSLSGHLMEPLALILAHIIVYFDCDDTLKPQCAVDIQRFFQNSENLKCSPAPYGHVRSPYVRSVFRTAPANS
jgi:hypothetical protein